MKQVNVAIAIVIQGRQILICQRKADAALGGFWEFPGGKIEPAESPADCARREVMEEVGIVVETVEPLPAIDYDYRDVRVHLHPFLCRYVEGATQARECQQAIWVDPDALENYQFPPADDSLLKELRQRFGRKT